jgi:hypothetical protein
MSGLWNKAISHVPWSQVEDVVELANRLHAIPLKYPITLFCSEMQVSCPHHPTGDTVSSPTA